MSAPIYLDYNATTPVAPQVQAAITHCLADLYGNPSSGYVQGLQAAAAVAKAREQIAQLIDAQPDQLTFTGCATEANNLALLGVARALAADPSTVHKRHLIISAIEHPAVEAPAAELERQGWRVTRLPVDQYGLIALADLEQALNPETALVSIMHANNEIGTLQPIHDIAALAHRHGALVHTDAAQSAGKVSIDVEQLGVDLLTLAGHKFYATKGIGALYVRPGTPIANILFGADQEQGLRPGTENTPAIVGMGAAAELAVQHLAEHPGVLSERRDQLHQLLAEAIPGIALNGHPEQRLPNTLHISFPGVSGRELLAQCVDEVSASVGSACHSAEVQVSGVLAALGLDASRAMGAVRLSTGWSTSEQDIERAAKALVKAWKGLVDGNES